MKYNVSINLPFDYSEIEATTEHEAIKKAEQMAVEEMQGEGWVFDGLIFIDQTATIDPCICGPESPADHWATCPMSEISQANLKRFKERVDRPTEAHPDDLIPGWERFG